MRLDDAVALVTGSARRVGRAILLELAAAGAHVVVHNRAGGEEAERAAEEARALGVDAAAFAADLADPDAIRDLFGAIRERFGRLDVLVNGAARFDAEPLEAVTAASWDATMAVNLRAPLLCAQAAAPLMRRASRREGDAALIVNVGDLSGIHPWRGYVQHGVSKAGLLHLTRILARELAPDIRVNALVPGAILPPPGMDDRGDAWQAVARRVPLERTGEASDVARAVRFLAESPFVTGAVLAVDGGEGLLGPVGH